MQNNYRGFDVNDEYETEVIFDEDTQREIDEEEEVLKQAWADWHAERYDHLY